MARKWRRAAAKQQPVAVSNLQVHGRAGALFCCTQLRCGRDLSGLLCIILGSCVYFIGGGGIKSVFAGCSSRERTFFLRLHKSRDRGGNVGLFLVVLFVLDVW